MSPSVNVLFEATIASPFITTVSTSAVVVSVATTPVILVVVVLPAVAVLLMTTRAVLIPVALASPAAVHLGSIMPVVIVVLLPQLPSARISSSGRLLVERFGKSAIKLLELLHMELPHVVPLWM